MSWSEVKKINSDFAREPLNFNNYINDMSVFGSRSYVLDVENDALWRDLIIHSLVMFGHDAIHETVYNRFTDEDVDYMIRNNGQLGQSFNSFYSVTNFVSGGIDTILGHLDMDAYDVLEPKFKSGIYRYISENTKDENTGKWLGTIFNNEEFKAKTTIESIVSDADLWTRVIMDNPAMKRVISISETTVQYFASNPSDAYVDFITEVCHNTDATMSLFRSLKIVNGITDFMNNEAVVQVLANNRESMVATTFMLEPFAAMIASEVAMNSVANSDVAVEVIIDGITNVANSEVVLDGIDINLEEIKNALPNIANTEIIISEVGEAKDLVTEVADKLGTISSQTHTLISNIHDLVNSSTAINAILASSTAINAILASETAMNVVYGSSTFIAKYMLSAVGIDFTAYTDLNSIAVDTSAITSIIANGLAMNIFVKSTCSWEDKRNFVMALNKSTSYVRSIYTTCNNNPEYFVSYLSRAATNLTTLSSYGNTPNTIIVCCLGRSTSTSGYYTELNINGELIAKGGYSSPSEVSSSNANAVGIPVSTFTSETGSCKTALSVFLAL